MKWWEGLAAVAVPGPEGHGLAWAEGSLALDAHPDPDAERALGALGGDRCRCLDVLDAWEAQHVDGGILVSGPRRPEEVIIGPSGAADELTADLNRWRGAVASLIGEANDAGHHDEARRLAARVGPAAARAARRLGLLLLLGLDPTLLHRLQASVAASLAARDPSSVVLSVATAARAIAALRSVGWAGGLDGVVVGESARLEPAAAILPPGWVADVWGRDLATAIPDHLVVEIGDGPDPGTMELVGMAPGKSEVARRVVPVGE